jgi:hypothetical protein
VNSLGMRLATVLMASMSLAACSHDSTATTPDSQTALQAIPPADAVKYNQLRDLKNWRNPYLIVRIDGVALLDAADNAEIHLKTEELLPTLAKLPPSKWPYGRVVAATENGLVTSEQDRVAIRRNKGIIGGLLESAHIAVKWVPSA